MGRSPRGTVGNTNLELDGLGSNPTSPPHEPRRHRQVPQFAMVQALLVRWQRRTCPQGCPKDRVKICKALGTTLSSY